MLQNPGLNIKVEEVQGSCSEDEISEQELDVSSTSRQTVSAWKARAENASKKAKQTRLKGLLAAVGKASVDLNRRDPAVNDYLNQPKESCLEVLRLPPAQRSAAGLRRALAFVRARGCLQDLTDADAFELCRYLIYRRVRHPRSIVCRQGEVGQFYYVVLSGDFNTCTAVSASTGGGPDEERVRDDEEIYDGQLLKKVAVLSQGRAFGERSLLKGTPRNAYVVSATEGELLCVSKKDYLVFLAGSHKKDLQEKMAFLRLVPCFSMFTDDTLHSIAEQMNYQVYKSNEIVWRQGERFYGARFFPMVVHGEVEVLFEPDGGTEGHDPYSGLPWGAGGDKEGSIPIAAVCLFTLSRAAFFCEEMMLKLMQIGGPPGAGGGGGGGAGGRRAAAEERVRRARVAARACAAAAGWPGSRRRRRERESSKSKADSKLQTPLPSRRGSTKSSLQVTPFKAATHGVTLRARCPCQLAWVNRWFLTDLYRRAPGLRARLAEHALERPSRKQMEEVTQDHYAWAKYKDSVLQNYLREHRPSSRQHPDKFMMALRADNSEQGARCLDKRAFTAKPRQCRESYECREDMPKRSVSAVAAIGSPSLKQKSVLSVRTTFHKHPETKEGVGDSSRPSTTPVRKNQMASSMFPVSPVETRRPSTAGSNDSIDGQLRWQGEKQSLLEGRTLLESNGDLEDGQQHQGTRSGGGVILPKRKKRPTQSVFGVLRQRTPGASVGGMEENSKPITPRAPSTLSRAMARPRGGRRSRTVSAASRSRTVSPTFQILEAKEEGEGRRRTNNQEEGIAGEDDDREEVRPATSSVHGQRPQQFDARKGRPGSAAAMAVGLRCAGGAKGVAPGVLLPAMGGQQTTGSSRPGLKFRKPSATEENGDSSWLHLSLEQNMASSSATEPPQHHSPHPEESATKRPGGKRSGRSSCHSSGLGDDAPPPAAGPPVLGGREVVDLQLRAPQQGGGSGGAGAVVGGKLKGEYWARGARLDRRLLALASAPR